MARSAYYKWLHHKPSKREIRDQKILKQIKEIAKSNNSLFGSPKMTMALNAQRKEGEPVVYRRTVSRIMCVNGIRTSKGRFNKNIIISRQRPKRQQEICLNVILMPTSPIKNGAQISRKRRFLATIKKYFFAQFLTFTIDIQFAMPLVDVMI
ncbi:IS3 family transposase [Lactobacillus ultunensis]|uniref:HTH-like domain-containing protein n=1 Tax=Lactobacillus ultunensis DSM 16047 TaxID=525365 RepID=C2EPQ5_9LACO|nr:IS3 family transposase [Lactobacillus ultunensis]EEJ71494.1 hypothetical protein HMPREF0548_1651 [Lactobacillus ultunensis DSM 16047]